MLSFGIHLICALAELKDYYYFKTRDQDSCFCSTVNCTAGTYLNKTSGTCEDCPVGSYQEFEGKEQCLSCSPKTSTVESRTENRSSCLGKHEEL